MWWYFILGLLVGWLIEWIIDWMYWRRGEQALAVNATQSSAARTQPAVAHGLAAGAAPWRDDELTAVEGIGPKIAQLLVDSGIRTFSDLAGTPMGRLVEILDQAGPSFRLANPDTWPEQAGLAARGEWAAFEKLKDELTGGVRTSAS